MYLLISSRFAHPETSRRLQVADPDQDCQQAHQRASVTPQPKLQQPSLLEGHCRQGVEVCQRGAVGSVSRLPPRRHGELCGDALVPDGYKNLGFAAQRTCPRAPGECQ